MTSLVFSDAQYPATDAKGRAARGGIFVAEVTNDTPYKMSLFTTGNHYPKYETLKCRCYRWAYGTD